MAHRKHRNQGRGASRPGQKAAGSLWLWGTHAAFAALHNPARIVTRILATEETLRKHAGDLEGLPPDRPAPENVGPGAIGALLPAQSVHQGIAVLAKPLEPLGLKETCETLEGEKSLVLVLDQVTDPRNVGAILRSAAAFGVRAIVSPQAHTPAESGALAKAASGALERVPFVRVPNLARALGQLADLGYWRIGLDSDADQVLSAKGQGNAVALIFGAEGSGMRRLTAEHCDLRARLATRPVAGATGSLNVSVAAAVALYEFARG